MAYDTNKFMDWWRQLNNELAALYHDEVAWSPARHWFTDRFRGGDPRVIARWYVADLHAS